jgi:16S rRNA (guanine966-N2)-methyltransferase
MTRIIAGVARGRRLAVPEGQSTRPTSDRAREGLFSALDAWYGGEGDLAGLRLLDPFAGSGAIGLEALSRGAAAALLVESDRKAAAAIEQNLRTLALPGGRLLVDRAERVAAMLCADPPYDVLFIDPPYVLETDRVLALLADFASNGWLAADAMVCVERATRDPAWVWPPGFERPRSRAYGEGTLWYGTRSDKEIQ